MRCTYMAKQTVRNDSHSTRGFVAKCQNMRNMERRGTRRITGRLRYERWKKETEQGKSSPNKREGDSARRESAVEAGYRLAADSSCSPCTRSIVIPRVRKIVHHPWDIPSLRLFMSEIALGLVPTVWFWPGLSDFQESCPVPDWQVKSNVSDFYVHLNNKMKFIFYFIYPNSIFFIGKQYCK